MRYLEDGDFEVIFLTYTDEELGFLWKKLCAAISCVFTPYDISPEENAFLDYFHELVRAEPTSWDDDEPKDLTILTDPLWKMPLRINDDSLVMRTVAAGRLEIAR